MELSTVSKTELLEKLERARGAIKAAKVHGKRVGRQFVDATLVAGAGVVDGFLVKRHPQIMGKDAGLVVGAAGVTLAMAEVFDGVDREAISFFGGLLACGVSRMTVTAITNHDNKGK